MQPTDGLDSLLDGKEPHATFHDAELLSVQVDYRRRELIAMWRVCVGDPNANDRAERERRREARVTLHDLAIWAMEPPAKLDPAGGPPWLTADGPLEKSTTTTGQSLAKLLPAGARGWYWYFSDLNAFAYCGAGGASFQWV
jgi:hypothetical protein